MQGKTTRKASEFLESLNQISMREQQPQFGYHAPKEDVVLAYAYTYVPTEKQAREVASWLLHKCVESEILYVDNKKQFLIKIPFVNTYYKEYFEKEQMPDALIAIKALLVEAIKQVGLEWTGKCSQLLKMVELFYTSYRQNRKIQKSDFVQTTFFTLGVNYGSSTDIDQLVDQKIDLSYLIGQVENIISNIHYFDKEKIGINRELTGKSKKKGIALDQARLSFSRAWISYINRFFLICTTNLFTVTEVRQLDNFLYQQWLFINKQLQLIKSDGKNAQYLEKWQDLKTRCMSVAQFSRKKLEETPQSLYMDGIEHYIAGFLAYENGLLDGDEKEIIDKEKTHVDSVIQKNERDLRDIRDKYEALKTEVTQLAHEMFASSNTGPSPKDDITDSKVGATIGATM